MEWSQEGEVHSCAPRREYLLRRELLNSEWTFIPSAMQPPVSLLILPEVVTSAVFPRLVFADTRLIHAASLEAARPDDPSICT